MKIIKYLIPLLLMVSCVKKDSNDFWIFKIKEGKHKSTNKVNNAPVSSTDVHNYIILCH